MSDCIVIAVLNGIKISHQLFTPEMVLPTESISGTTFGLWCMELHTQPSCGLIKCRNGVADNTWLLLKLKRRNCNISYKWKALLNGTNNNSKCIDDSSLFLRLLIIMPRPMIFQRDESCSTKTTTPVHSVMLNLVNKCSQCTFSVAELYGLFSGLIK